MKIAHRFEVFPTPQEFYIYEGEEIVETYLGILYQVLDELGVVILESNLLYIEGQIYDNSYISKQTGIILGKTEFF